MIRIKRGTNCRQRSRTTFWWLTFLSLSCFNTIAQDFEDSYKILDSAYHVGDFEKVLEIEPLIVSQMGLREDTLVANAYYYIGDVYLGNFQMQTALSYFGREKELREKLLPLDPSGYSNTLYNLMFVHLQNGTNELAVQIGKELLDFDRATYTVNSEAYIQSAGDYFDVLVEVDRWQQAESEAKMLMTSLPDKSSLAALVEAKLGRLYTYRGLYSKAGRCYESALPILEASYGRTSEEYQVNLANYSNLLMSQGKYDQAEELLMNSLEIIQASNWPSRDQLYYAALNNLSITYSLLGQYSKAETMLNEVLRNDSLTVGIDNPDFAISLSNLGQLYTDESRFAEAEAVLQQSLAILSSRGESSSVSYARKLNNLARNFQYAGQSSRAIPLLEQALRLFGDNLGKNSPEYATALLNLGIAHMAINPTVGFSYLKKAETLRRKVLGRKHPLYAASLEKLALYQWKKRNKKEVKRLMGLVFENYFNQVSDFFPVLTEEEKSNLFFNTIRPSQELFASWVTADANNSPENLGELYTITVNTKGLILYATDRVRAKILQSGDSALIALYESWELQKELLAFYYSNNQNPGQIDSLLRVSQSTEKELSRRSAAFSKDMIRPQRDWKQIQRALKPGDAAIELVRFRKYNIDSLKFGNKIHYACLILTSDTKDGPRLVLLADGNLLEGKYLNYYRNGIQFKVDDEYTYNYFWLQIHKQLKALRVNKIYLSADGVFNLLSLGAIKNPETKKYLLEELDIHLIGSTRDLLLPSSNKSIGQSSLLIGYPQYNLSHSSTLLPANSQVNKLMSRSIRGSLSRFLRGTSGIAALPGTKREVELISEELAKKHEPMVLLDADATEQRIKQTASPDILHIATHGYFLEDEAIENTPNPLLNSGLILAGAANFIRHGKNPLHAEDDGVLTAYEAMNLDLEGTNLVVLSACETGLGTIQNGEGVYGLQRAFQLAGAKYIIMSLWPVDDEATQFLMSEFYRQWTETENVREAFRLAQLNAKSKFNASYYWGAFILIGL